MINAARADEPRARRIAAALIAALAPVACGRATEPIDPASCCPPADRTPRPTTSAGAAAAGPAASGQADPAPPATAGGGAPPGMVWIPAGEFSMGSTDPLARPDESPVHRVRVEGFWIDATEVTNAQFAEFVAATGYVTVAERPVVWEELAKQLPPGTPKPPEETLLPGSLVFTPPDRAVDTRDPGGWWRWTTGACWRRPEGPASTVEGRERYPVVHVAWEDAVAYARWAGKALPTEAQWEYAARGGLDGKRNAWGDAPIDATRANVWQGRFPDLDTAEDGFARAAPVASFPPNGYGLHDMAGNVWEWCSDLYRPDTYARRAPAGGRGEAIVDPAGPERSLDPRNPDAPESRVHRGGSFLCNDSYCASYRPSARMAAPPDTGLQHLGFRCVIPRAAWESREPREPGPGSQRPPR